MTQIEQVIAHSWLKKKKDTLCTKSIIVKVQHNILICLRPPDLQLLCSPGMKHVWFSCSALDLTLYLLWLIPRMLGFLLGSATVLHARHHTLLRSDLAQHPRHDPFRAAVIIHHLSNYSSLYIYLSISSSYVWLMLKLPSHHNVSKQVRC